MSDDSRKVALVTGSGRRRVGNVIVRQLADAGYGIALHYHSSAQAAEATQRELQEQQVPCEAFQADLAEEAQVEAMFDGVLRSFRRLDLLVTTASIWETQTLEEVTSADVLRSFRVNTLATFLCARRAGLAMVGQDAGGCIVTIGDWAIQRPYPDHTAYFMAKGAIPTMTKALAVELAQRNPRVRVNCVMPGPVLFPPDASEQEREAMIDSTLTRAANRPEVVGDAVLFLAGNEFVTGACLPVDGGRSIYAGESRARKRPI